MNYGSKLQPELRRIGTYSSPKGGSRHPAQIPRGYFLFEIIQEGTVYGHEPEPILHGEGSIFCHHEGQWTISDSPDDSYYNCLVAWFRYPRNARNWAWPKHFQWQDQKAMHRFADEMLLAFHYAALDRQVIGNLVLSRLHFELEQFRTASQTHAVHPQLRLATDYINAHYAKPISLDDVAAMAGISVSHLHMLFRDHHGESPHQYLIQKRMRVAGHALASTDSPIKAIAADVGYANTENFCRAFRKFYGRSASEYRLAYTQSQQSADEANNP